MKHVFYILVFLQIIYETVKVFGCRKLHRETEAMEAMEEGLLADPEIIQLNVAKSKKLGRYHMMTGLNPIYIISDGGDTE